MGEYVFTRIYKPMQPVNPFSNTFEKICWDLKKAKDDRKKIEEIYRSINFVNPNGDIFDLCMNFIERDGIHYQSNSGVLGTKELPNLFLSYKYEFHDFWLSILKPNELIMDEHNTIKVEISGKELHERFFKMKVANKNNNSFSNSQIYKLYYESTKWQPSLVEIVKDDDIIQILVGNIYSGEGEEYRTNARKSITKQRKDIASNFYIPHWAKASS